MKSSPLGSRGPRRMCASFTSSVLLITLLICAGASVVVADEEHHQEVLHTKFRTAIAIPGNPIRSFDISWVDSDRGLYFLGDRSNAGVDIISTQTNTFIGRAGGFVGIALLGSGAVDNNHSGPDGVVSHGHCLYAGDGNSTLRVYDISDPTNPQLVGSPISTGGTTRLDEMALTTDGETLLAVNNAEDPPFATLFSVDEDTCTVSSPGTQITADSSVIPPGSGLSIEQPAWNESIHRFIVSVPTIAENPPGCSYGTVNPGAPPCSGAALIIDPDNLENPITDDFVPLVHCGPNGASVGPDSNVMLGCTPNNQPGDNETTILNGNSVKDADNAKTTFRYVDVGGLTGSDEVWFNPGSNRYYTGSSAMPGGAVLGVVDGTTNFLLEAIPQSSASHSVAADSERNEIYVPQVAPRKVVGAGGDVTGPTKNGIGGVGEALCGTDNGCVAVFVERRHKADDEDGEDH